MVTARGTDAQTTWQGLVAGRSGLTRVSSYDAAGENVAVSGEVASEQASALAQRLPPNAPGRTERFVHCVRGCVGGARASGAIHSARHRTRSESLPASALACHTRPKATRSDRPRLSIVE